MVVEVPELVISAGIDFPPYTQRGVIQSLAPIAASSQLVRTINGALVDVSDSNFQKLASQVTCTDINVPVWVFPGLTVTVDCVAELAGLAADFYEDLLRPVVPDTEPREEGDYVFYRPRLTMKIVSWSFNHDEWGRRISWTLNLEEV